MEEQKSNSKKIAWKKATTILLTTCLAMNSAQMNLIAANNAEYKEFTENIITDEDTSDEENTDNEDTSDEENTDNKDTSDEENTDNKDTSDEENTDNEDTSDEENTDNEDTSDEENTDNKDTSDEENTDNEDTSDEENTKDEEIALEALKEWIGILSEVEYFKFYYTESSYNEFQTALQAAITLLDEEEGTVKEINTSIENLKNAYKDLEKKINDSDVTSINKAFLNKKITEIKTISSENYTEESYKDLQEALVKAKEVIQNENATLNEINEAVEALICARERLKEKVELYTKELVNKIAELEKISEDEYTEESYETLLEAIANAKEILADPLAMQNDIDSALEELINAESWLEEPEYYIEYELKGGNNNKDNPDTYYPNEKIELLAPTRKGYIFKGWYSDSKYKNKITFIAKGSEKDYTLYAKWQKANIKKVTIKSTTNVKGKKIKLVLKKVDGVTGYEISYSTNKKFTKKTTKVATTKKATYSAKKLTKNTLYFIRVRTYTIDSTNKTVYGKYSNVQKVTVTK